jgi:hypothetical protein
LVAWSWVQRPLHLGGLGVLDQRLLGIALWVRWLWLQRVEPERLWAALPVKADPVLVAFFQASICCMVSDRKSTRFWSDPWLDGCFDGPEKATRGGG